MTAPHEIYSRLLFKAAQGYPLWNPALPAYCPKEYKLAGMQVGDVGYLTLDGGFFFLFNISLSKDHPINKWRGVPDDFIPVDLGPSEVYHQSFPEFHPPKSVFCYTEKGAKTIEGDITASIPGPGHAPVTVQARGGHHSSYSEAAALVLLKGGSKNDNYRNLSGWAAQYAGRLYRYANIELGLDVPNGGMYLITGVTNTEGWYISSFSEKSGGNYGSFEVGVKGFLSGNLSASTASSVTGSCAPRYSPPHHKGQNQSVFIRGLKMMMKSDLFRRLTPDVTKIQTATFSVLSKVGPPPYSSGNIHETPPNISSSTTRREESHGGEAREGIMSSYNIPSSITMRREPHVGETREETTSNPNPSSSTTRREHVGETREETTSNPNISSSTTRREPHGGDTREASRADKGKKAARNRRSPSPRPSGPAGRKKDGPGGGAGGAGQSGGQGSGGNARGGGGQADRNERKDNEGKFNSGGGKESGSGRQHGVWADKEIFLDDSELDDSADPILHPYHPSDIINKYLLQMCPKSEVALTHDDIWSSIFQESDPVLDDEDLLERINASYTIHESENKACIFVSRDGRETHPQSLMVEGVDFMVGRTSEARFYPEVATQTLYAQEPGFDDGVALHTDVGTQGHVRVDVADSHKLQLQSGARPLAESGLRLSPNPNQSEQLWWGDSEKHVPRPGHNSPELRNTRKRVAQAIASALGTAADITHEALYIGVDLLELAPVPGLKPAAQLLLNIWDAVRLVDMNRLGCLRLTERCADILISVRLEIFNAGDAFEQELAAPVQKLEESFEGVYHFFTKQNSRPFLKRYLRRDETLRDISACHSSLQDALGLFGVSIQIRILKQVQESEKHREAETKAPSEDIAGLDFHMPDSTLEHEAAGHLTTTGNSLGLIDDRAFSLPSATSSQDRPHSQIIPALTSLQSLQNLSDMEMDAADLCQLIRATLQTTSDVEMLEVLQVGHQEMPDAIKTLQRASEHERNKDGGNDVVETSPENYVVMKEVEEHGAPRKRSETITSTLSTTSSRRSSERRKDTLDREFIQSGINALRRMSHDVQTSLPSWTITKSEIDRDEKIGISFFSDVYRGSWRGRTVAIKVVADSTPRKLFVREIEIWNTLRHHNVLPLYGASGASYPPWFFVSPYMKKGSLVQYLRRVELEMPLSSIRRSESNLGSRTFPAAWTAVHREWDLFRFMHEIAKGMEYLHSQGVLHGDLKGANVLVDDEYRCVISDFGQSEMKSEAYRISGTLAPHGTLRWQSPELMGGQSQLTREIDVWAFAICCVEILTMGRIPWPLHSDDSVRHFVLTEDGRPPLPNDSRFNTEGLQDILRTCWSTKPVQRPTFSKLVEDFKQLRESCGQEVTSQSEESISTIDDGCSSHPSDDEMIANTRNERRYRFFLTHDYHPSLTLPLWEPSLVEIGAVGFLSKPQGRFVTLFNALTPDKSNDHGIQSLPSIHEYGPAESKRHRQDKRSVAQKSRDVVASFVSFRPFPLSVSRHYSYPLQAGHKMAYLCTEMTDYQYLDKLDAPKKWFQTHIDFIMETYENQYHLQKEQIFLVIGTLSAPNYALFVSHSHPQGHAQFNVYAAPKDGQPWGVFTTVPASDRDDESIDIKVENQATKVSCHGGPWNTVLLARLRFKPDNLEPTSN